MEFVVVHAHGPQLKVLDEGVLPLRPIHPSRAGHLYFTNVRVLLVAAQKVKP